MIRKFGDFTDASPALLRAAMSARLHAVLDALMGQGRVLLQEMALVKPPRVSGDKPWHQDAAYFRGSDPGLMFGVWIALDPATRENGCMEVIPGSHLRGPAPHVPAEDINLCTIRPDLVRLADRVALPMEPGDVLIFHSLIHHYTAANRSDRRRRALQFHYHQVGLEWTSLEAHRALYHDADGGYAGCTVPKGAPFSRGLLLRAEPVAAGRADGIGYGRWSCPCASGEMVTAGVSKTPGGNSLPVRVRPRADPPSALSCRSAGAGEAPRGKP